MKKWLLLLALVLPVALLSSCSDDDEKDSTIDMSLIYGDWKAETINNQPITDRTMELSIGENGTIAIDQDGEWVASYYFTVSENTLNLKNASGKSTGSVVVEKLTDKNASMKVTDTETGLGTYSLTCKKVK